VGILKEFSGNFVGRFEERFESFNMLAVACAQQFAFTT
jgi:hypothetical protein